MTDIPTHPHHSDGIQVNPLHDATGCLDCPMPQDHPVHTLPDTHDAQAEHRRRLAEEE